MTATIKDDLLPRSIMFLFVGAALLLLGIHWRSTAKADKLSRIEATRAETTDKGVKATPFTQPLTLLQQSLQAVTKSNRSSVSLSSANASKTASVSTAQVPAPKDSVNLVVDLSDRRVYLYQEKQLAASYPVAVGQDGWETPTGPFRVMHMQRDPNWLHPITKEVVGPGPDNPLGRRWIGFWFDGRTEIGFHGTNQEELIGLAVSHGCLRMRNKDVEAMYQQVSQGTPVVVRP